MPASTSCFLFALVGLASAATDSAEVQQQSWQAYLTPRNILFACFILYGIGSTGLSSISPYKDWAYKDGMI